MTAPESPAQGNPGGPDGSSSSSTGGAGKKGKAPALDLLSVVSFARTNPVTRREHRGVGVVVAVDDQGVTVVPIHDGHTVRVAADEVAVVSADEAGEV